MPSPRRSTRRHFLGTTTVAASSLVAASLADGAEPGAADGEYPSTAHFWYRRQPAGMYIDSQRANKALGRRPGEVCLSEDNGRTWPHRLAFPDAERINYSVILKNGNVLFATGARLYLSEDNLKSCRPVTVLDAHGNEYRPHTPKNPNCPGWYFHTLPGINSFDVHGREMLVWGNYCNVLGGATPVNIYYSTDNGRTVKIAYAFGQNPAFADDGSEGGGKGGTPLGDPDNPVLCRHTHCVTYNPGEDAFYACTGDIDQGRGHECHWLRGTYDAAADRWQWKVIVSTQSNTRYKCGGICFVDGQVYWIADANGPLPHDRGVFRCDPADIARPERHTRLFNPGIESANMIIQDGVIVATHCAPASPMATGIMYSPDMGKTWFQYDLKEFGPRSGTRLHEKNSEGWFRMDLRVGWIGQADVIFLKPKPIAT